MHKREGSSQMRTIAYKVGGGFKIAYVRKKTFWTTKSQKKKIFSTKEAITLPLIIVCRKV